ncbi:ABC transporter permease [Mesobacillus foraminis]|uniref:Sodium transport system permease protein n=1 Tax=Mesobacillus foraminis TaxID=279826 RepID=A0A4R2B119_9BACI|nr:ABC transporter permease [Mesobacillus foraminis]TCN19916.1 sodium transport system permease protein [Mesobacillus foraminis]
MLLKIYLKELKDCFRDRRTLFLTVLLPIVMMTGLTFFYEQLVSGDEGETYTLAVDQSFGKEEEKILAGFDNIDIVKSSDPEKTLEDGDAAAALVLSPDFISKIESGQEASVTMVGDSFSQKSSNLMSLVSNALSIYEKTVISERLQAQGTDLKLIQPFTIDQKEMSEEDPNINLIAMLIPLILSIAIGIGAGPAASDLFAGEKERKTMEALLMTPVKRPTLLFAKWLTIATIGAVTGIITLIVVAIEINLLTENLRKAVSFGDNAGLVIGFGVLVSVIYAMFTASLLMLTSVIGKTVKESQSYSTPIMMLAVFPTMITTGIGVNELSFQHFAIPVLNLFSLLKELLFGVINYEHILITIASNLICMIIIFIIGRILFLKDKWVMN